MQCIEDITEVICRVVHASNNATTWVMVVEMFWSGIVTNGCTIVPLKQPTLIDENAIAVLISVHYQDCLECVDLDFTPILDSCLYRIGSYNVTYIICGSEKGKRRNLIPINDQHPITCKVCTDLS